MGLKNPYFKFDTHTYTPYFKSVSTYCGWKTKVKVTIETLTYQNEPPTSWHKGQNANNDVLDCHVREGNQSDQNGDKS